MVALARRQADECEGQMLACKDQVRSMRAAGQDSGLADKALAELESVYDGVIAEMQALLDELDRQAEIAVTQLHEDPQVHEDPQESSSP